MECAVCGDSPTTLAHVKSHSEFRKKGMKNHELNNLIPMCYDCHYNFFDSEKMALYKESNGNATFFKMENDGSVKMIKSSFSLNIRDEYVKWKNAKCSSRVKFALVKYKRSK